MVKNVSRKRNENMKYSIFGIILENIEKRKLKQDILTLAFVSILTKIVMIFITTKIFHSFIDLFDISVYLGYALNTYQGQIPYVDFSIEYPQLALVPILIPLIFAIITQNLNTYLHVYQIFMTILDMLTTLLVYFIALKFYSQKRAFLSGILYATSFSSAYFAITKFDAFPTFLLMLSLFFFIYKKETAGYIWGAMAFLAKWFPVFAIPYYLIFDYQNNKPLSYIAKKAAVSFAVVIAVMLPFFAYNPSMFIETYKLQIGREPLAHSFIYYINYISSHVSHFSLPANAATLLMLIGQIILLYKYYKLNSKSYKSVSIFIFSSIFLFVILNQVFSPQYILWITPFFSLFLLNTSKGVILHYLCQTWFYLEFPLLYNSIYTNGHYYQLGNVFLSIPFLFFTIKFAILFSIAITILKQIDDRPANKNKNQ